LKVPQCLVDKWAKNPINAARVKAQARKAYLEGGDVVTAQEWCLQKEQPLTQAPRGLFETFPGGLVDHTGNGQAPNPLKGLDGCHGGLVKDLTTGGHDARGVQALVQD
jgi:hypothetical protein